MFELLLQSGVRERKGTWLRLANSPTELSDFGAARRGQQIVTFGGYPRNNRLMVYDIPTDTWETRTISGTVPSVSNLHKMSYSHLTDKFYISGGYDGSKILDTMLELDLDTNTFTQKKKLPTTLRAHGQCVLPNGKLVIACGVVTGPGTGVVYQYDPLLDDYTILGSVGSDSGVMVLPLDDTNVLIDGGLTTGKTTQTIRVNFSNPGATTVHNLPQSTPIRGRHSAGLFGGDLIVFGGTPNPSTQPLQVLKAGALTWEPVKLNNPTVKPTGRYTQETVQLNDKQFIVLGGWTSNALNETWLFTYDY